MSSAIAPVAAQRLNEKPKSELVQSLMRMRATARAHKETAKKAGLTLFGGVVAGAGGATAGFLATKMPVIPRTQVPSDLALGGAICALCAVDVFDGADQFLSDYAKGLIGAGMKDVTIKLLNK